jgi:hypothetical protein
MWKPWVQHLAGIKSSFIKTNALEVWSLDPDGYDAYWNELLNLFAEPTVDHLAIAAKANDLEFNREKSAIHWHEPERIACKLAGAEHIGEVPWLQNLPDADPPSAGDHERKRQYEDLMKQVEQLAGSELRKIKIMRAIMGLGLLVAVGLVIWYFVRR